MLTPQQLSELHEEADARHRRVGATAGFLLGLIAGLGIAAVLAVYFFGVW